ncbi:helix-turn-helix domain-containing protein [Streptomyces sp. NPDC096339]|uniref:helix-turn-helix domain-containing protein n=1 Tax=Streptomyces sp. NPDC096339 TaxID=3366086 RepID=UPI00380BF3F8
MEAREVAEARVRFAIGAGYAFYEGPTTDNSTHRHAAFQLAVAPRGELTMVDAAGVRHRGTVLAVPPMVAHRMVPAPYQRTFFVEPHCAFADRLRELCGSGISAVPELRGLSERDLLGSGARPSSRLDGRLLSALNAPAAEGLTMPELAARVGLSPQRLRALARQQLGMTLARRRIWHRLARTAGALRAGRSPAEAAVLGGFADQAHFTRQMREMIGITPTALVAMLRASDPSGPSVPAGPSVLSDLLDLSGPSRAPGDVDGDRTGNG